MARDAPGARRHRGDRLGDPAAPARVGGLGPPRRLHRPARGLPHLRAALPRRPPRTSCMRAQTVEAPGRDRRVRPDGGARLQPDVRDDDRPGQGVGRRPPTCARRPPRGSSSTSRTCCSSRARSRPSGSPRSGKSFRNEITPGQLHLPHARVRADGDGVLRAAGGGRSNGSSTGSAERERWYIELGHPARPPAPARARRRTSSRTTPRARATSNTCSRSAGRSSRASPTAATST